MYMQSDASLSIIHTFCPTMCLLSNQCKKKKKKEDIKPEEEWLKVNLSSFLPILIHRNSRKIPQNTIDIF